MIRQLPDHVEIAIIGSGFSGIGAAIRLKQEGWHDIVVLERGDSVGGTWRDNTYPGCACDVPSNLYSFSYAPEPGWTRAFAPAAEIHAYLERCADRFGVRPHVHLQTEATSSRWDEGAEVWRIETNRGALSARFLIAGVGPLAEPALPEVPGLDTFTGAAFHSARWDHSLDLRGRRVAVVGTGASSVQLIPKIAPAVERLTVLQRTPAWVMPRRDRARPRWERLLYAKAPVLQRAVRGLSFGYRDLLLHRSFRGDRAVRRFAEGQARHLLERQVADPVLRAQLTPHYELGCKRVLLSDDFYPALSRPNVILVPAGLSEVRPTSVVDARGDEHDVDTLVFGTGFRVPDLPAAGHTYGIGGISLAEAWAGSPVAYAGLSVTGFPNLFLLLGPNTGLGHNSVVVMIEAQIEYTLQALRTVGRIGCTVIDVRPDRQEADDHAVQAAMEGTVWTTGGCRSWYFDRNDRIAAIWPWPAFRYRRRLARFDPSDYVLRRPDGVVTDDDVLLHVEVREPSSEPAAAVVFLHGWTIDSRMWHHQLSDLRHARSDLLLLAPDHRGHGRSGVGDTSRNTIAQTAEDLARVIERMLPADLPVVLVGHSMGGMTAMALAEQHPSLVRDRVRGLVLVNTSAGGFGELTYGLPWPLSRAFGIAIPWALRRGAIDEAAGRRRIQLDVVNERLAFARNALASRADVSLALQMERETAADVTRDFYASLREHDRVTALSAFADVPTVVLVGARDVLTPPSHGGRLASSIVRSDLRVFDDAGHMLPFERPSDVTAAVLDVVERIPVRASVS